MRCWRSIEGTFFLTKYCIFRKNQNKFRIQIIKTMRNNNKKLWIGRGKTYLVRLKWRWGDVYVTSLLYFDTFASSRWEITKKKKTNINSWILVDADTLPYIPYVRTDRHSQDDANKQKLSAHFMNVHIVNNICLNLLNQAPYRCSIHMKHNNLLICHSPHFFLRSFYHRFFVFPIWFCAIIAYKNDVKYNNRIELFSIQILFTGDRTTKK